MGSSRMVRFHLLAMGPVPSPRPSMSIEIGSTSMLFAIAPLAFIRATIRPCEFSMPRALLIFVLALKVSTIWPDHATLTVHFALCPLADASSTINMNILSVTIHGIKPELTQKYRAICELVCSITMLLTLQVLALEARTIPPGLYTLARFQVLLPLALI